MNYSVDSDGHPVIPITGARWVSSELDYNANLTPENAGLDPTRYATSEPGDWSDPFRKDPENLVRMDPLEIEGRVSKVPWLALGAVALAALLMLGGRRAPAMAGRRRRRRHR